MTVSLKHAFESAKSDGADSTLVQPSNWNAEHTLTMATGKLLGRTTASTGAVEEITVGTGLTLSAGELTASGVAVSDGDKGDIVVSSSGTVWSIDSGWTGGSSIATLGTITTGTWNGTTIAVANGGTGATSESAARTALGLAIGTDVQAYSSTLGAVAGGTYTGSSSITTLGTVTTGTWSATAIGPTKGGTGQTTYATGDLLYASASNTLSKLAAGTNTHVLTLSGGVPTWAAPSGGGGTPGGSTTEVQYNSSGSFAADSTFTFNATTKRVTANSFGLSGNISAAAWTTSGIRYANASVTLTDTTSSGTVPAAYSNFYGGNTIAASNTTTFTDYYTTWIAAPTAGTNVTLTRKWAFGTDGNIKAAQVQADAQTLSSSGIISETGTSRTLSATDNGKVIYCTSSSAITITCATSLGAGFSCVIIQGGTGQITVAAGSATLVSYGALYKTAGQYASVQLVSPVADTLLLAGQTA